MQIIEQAFCHRIDTISKSSQLSQKILASHSAVKILDFDEDSEEENECADQWEGERLRFQERGTEAQNEEEQRTRRRGRKRRRRNRRRIEFWHHAQPEPENHALTVCTDRIADRAIQRAQS